MNGSEELKSRLIELLAPHPAGGVHNARRQEFIRFLDQDILLQVEQLLVEYDQPAPTGYEGTYGTRAGRRRVRALAHQRKQLEKGHKHLSKHISSDGSKICHDLDAVAPETLERHVYARVYDFFRRYYERGALLSFGMDNDYAVHDNLGMFLRHQLSSYLKENLPVSDATPQASSAGADGFFTSTIIRTIAHKIIGFLETADNCQHKPDYSWQRGAIEKWVEAGRRGMIEAVTGSGKTHVGIEALADLYSKDSTLSTLVIVPTVPLMEQWFEKLSERFSGERIGRIGGGYYETYKVPPLAYVTTIHSALKHTQSLFSHCWDRTHIRRYKSFLIADECHHYMDAPVWSQIVKPPFHWDYTMGLSATIEPFEADGLGSIVETYSFKDAYQDGLVPAFDLVNMGVPLTDIEMGKYLELSERISDLVKKVLQVYETELRNLPDHWLFRRLEKLAGKIGSGKEPLIEKLFLTIFRRAEIYYMAQHKMELAERTTCKLMEQGKKIFVFFERIAAADRVENSIARRAGKALVDRVKQHGQIWCKAYHSGISKDERKRLLQEFQNQRSGALVVCRSLDEGIDVPDADGAILAASTKSARQRIQRIGRVLRRGDGTKRPVIVTLFAKGTADEGVTAEDHREFDGIATIYEPVNPPDYVEMLERIQIIRHNDAPPPKSADKWHLFGEVGSDGMDGLLPLMSRYLRQGEHIKLEYADGRTKEGQYRWHTCHTIAFYGHSAPTEGLVRVYRETK